MNGTVVEKFLPILLDLGSGWIDAGTLAGTYDAVDMNSQITNGPIKGQGDIQGYAQTAYLTLKYVRGEGPKPEWAQHCGMDYNHSNGEWSVQS